MPSTSVLQRALLCALICAFSPVVSAQLGEREKLTKESERLDKLIAREEARLAKKKEQIEKEFGQLLNASVQGTLASKLQKVGALHANGLKEGERDKRRAAESALLNDIKPILSEHVGSDLTGIVAPVLATSLATGVTDGNLDAAAAVKVTIEDLFPDPNFNVSFEGILKQEIFRNYAKLTHERDLVARQIEELDRRAAAAQAGIPPQMFKVPGGKHSIGLDDKALYTVVDDLGYKGRHDSQKLWFTCSPQHEVQFDDVFIDINEVTNAWYYEYLKDNPNAAVPRWWTQTKNQNQNGGPTNTAIDPGNEPPMYPEGWGDRPVSDLSFFHARDFARWMGRRVPTEFEWEVAARYTTQGKELRIWPWGDSWQTQDNLLCNNDMAIEHPIRRIIPYTMPPFLPVGTFPGGRSALGGNDFAGNALELTSSPFAPYPGFKPRKVGGGSVSGGDFEPDLIVLRGGDGLKRDIVVSTTWRTGFHPSLTSIYVGFRTAASATRGKDHVATLTERDALKRYLVDFPAIPTDQLARRTYAALDHQNPAGYSSLMMGGWDETRNLPARARHITAIRRVSEDFRDMDAVRALAKDGPVMLGFLHLDVPSVKPKLDPGDYFILWQNSYIPEPPPEEAEDEANPDEKPKKPAPKRAKPDPKKKPDPIPETFLFKRVGGKTLTPPVGFTDFLPAVQAAEQPLRMTPNPAKNTIDLQFPFPVKYKKDASFIVTLSLELAPGVVAQFK